MSPLRQLDSHELSIAHETHRLMLQACETKGMARARNQNVDGYHLPGTIASFIWAAASSVGGREIEQYNVDQIRRYLKQTKNVLTVRRLAERRFVIFVAGEWQQPNEDEFPQRRDETKLTASEAGEDREPAPVVIKRLPIKNGYNPSLQNTKILITLAELDSLENREGHISRLLQEKVEQRFGDTLKITAITPALKRLDEDNLITRDVHGKRTYRVSITKKGRKRAKVMAEHYELEGPSLNEPSFTPTDEDLELPEDQEEKSWWNDGLITTERVVASMIESEVERRVKTQSSSDLATRIQKILNETELSPLQMLVRIEEEVEG